jgi:hypothetical protein
VREPAFLCAADNKPFFYLAELDGVTDPNRTASCR